MKKLGFYRVTMGCDPEFFFAIKGKTIGAEKILPKEGLEYKPGTSEGPAGDGRHTVRGEKNSKVIIDGIQAELNPRANTCRANLGNEISACFREVYKKLESHPGVTAEFGQTVQITKEEMKSLDKASKQFGCTPSKNAYTEKNNVKIKDASRYYKRSAGGHIHLGHDGQEHVKKTLENHKELVPMLDIIVGNTCVLLDKDPGNIERRKNYGKAGEFRTPPHGIEYRTLSNFWLQSYQLMSLATGLARLAVNIVANSTPENDYAKAIRSKVSMLKIRQAINNNDYELAYKNFKAIEEVLIDMIDEDDEDDYPITAKTIAEFHYFVEKGINHWFKENPLEHWCKIPEGHGTGWEKFITTTVRKEYKESLKTK